MRAVLHTDCLGDYQWKDYKTPQIFIKNGPYLEDIYDRERGLNITCSLSARKCGIRKTSK